MKAMKQNNKPATKPVTKPEVKPTTTPNPDKDSPWNVPGPKVNPKPKGIKFTLF